MECLLCGSQEVEGTVLNYGKSDSKNCPPETSSTSTSHSFVKIFNIPLTEYAEELLQNNVISYCLLCKQQLRMVYSFVTQLESCQNKIGGGKKTIQYELSQTYRKSCELSNQNGRAFNSNSETVEAHLVDSPINCLRAKILWELQRNSVIGVRTAVQEIGTQTETDMPEIRTQTDGPEIRTQTDGPEIRTQTVVPEVYQRSNLDTINQNPTVRSSFGESLPPETSDSLGAINSAPHVKLEIKSENFDAYFQTEFQDNSIRIEPEPERTTHCETFGSNLIQMETSSSNSTELVSSDYQQVESTNAITYTIQRPTWPNGEIESYSRDDILTQEGPPPETVGEEESSSISILGLPETSIDQNETRIRYNYPEQDESLTCVHCNEIFDDLDRYIHHTNTAHFKRPNMDPNFSSDAAFLNLRGEARKREPYKCHICSRRFLYQPQLKTHVMFHLGIKPFKCNEEGCTSAFTTKGELTKHSKSHQHHHKCGFCKVSYQSVSSLYNHLRQSHNVITNTGQNSNKFNYKCEHCQACFYSGQDLHIHLKTVHPIKPQLSLCSQCNFQCESSAELEEHLSSHSVQQLPLSCDHCGQQFFNLASLEGHAAICHKNQILTSSVKVEEIDIIEMDP